MSSHSPQARVKPDSYKTITTVWLLLLALTAVLAAVSRASPSWAVAAMLTLTPLKAGLVFYYFMHLKDEGPLIKGMVAVALTALIVFIGMMFLDLSFR